MRERLVALLIAAAVSQGCVSAGGTKSTRDTTVLVIGVIIVAGLVIGVLGDQGSEAKPPPQPEPDVGP